MLVIDDEKNIRATLAVCLDEAGCKTRAVASVEAALEALERETFDLAFLALRLPDANGLDFLPRMLAVRPDLAVVVITAYATFETAVEAMRRGASDYLPKPFSPAQIRQLVAKTARQRAWAIRISDLEGPARLRGAGHRPPDRCPRHAAGVRDRDPRRGVGGADLAPGRDRHRQDRDGEGHPRRQPAGGAFTGAVRDQAGRVETAEGGTLFLDEIGEVSTAPQAKLLRFLQEKSFERVGENLTRHADVRIVTATNRDLEADVAAGRLREDLLFRLNVIEVRVPALRERREDIPRMARAFLSFFARSTTGRPAPEPSAEAEAALVAYAWPGNVRELRNSIERALILWPSARTLGPEALPERIAAHATALPALGADFTLEQIEREHVLRVLARSPTLEDAARTLGIDASALWRKRKKYEA